MQYLFKRSNLVLSHQARSEVTTSPTSTYVLQLLRTFPLSDYHVTYAILTDYYAACVTYAELVGRFITNKLCRNTYGTTAEL